MVTKVVYTHDDRVRVGLRSLEGSENGAFEGQDRGVVGEGK